MEKLKFITDQEKERMIPAIELLYPNLSAYLDEARGLGNSVIKPDTKGGQRRINRIIKLMEMVGNRTS